MVPDTYAKTVEKPDDLYTVETVAVDFKATVPTQAYGGVTVEQVWTARLKPGASPETASEDIFARCRKQVLMALQPIIERKKRDMDRIMADLPKAIRDQVIAELGPIIFWQAVAPEAMFAENAKEDRTKIEGN